MTILPKKLIFKKLEVDDNKVDRSGINSDSIEYIKKFKKSKAQKLFKS